MIVAIAVMLALGIQAFVLKPYKIPSGSMEPTLKVGQRVLANRIGMDVNGPYVGEIAVFHPPKDADQLPVRTESAQSASQRWPSIRRNQSRREYERQLHKAGSRGPGR